MWLFLSSWTQNTETGKYSLILRNLHLTKKFPFLKTTIYNAASSKWNKIFMFPLEKVLARDKRYWKLLIFFCCYNISFFRSFIHFYSLSLRVFSVKFRVFSSRSNGILLINKLFSHFTAFYWTLMATSRLRILVWVNYRWTKRRRTHFVAPSSTWPLRWWIEKDILLPLTGGRLEF